MRKGTKVVLPNGQEAKVVESDDRLPDRERVVVQVEGKSRPTIERVHRVTTAADADK